MRFDYFDAFWDMYKENFKKLGIRKDTAKEIYEMNYSNLNLFGEQDQKDKKKLYYDDVTSCEKDKYVALNKFF